MNNYHGVKSLFWGKHSMNFNTCIDSWNPTPIKIENNSITPTLPCAAPFYRPFILTSSTLPKTKWRTISCQCKGFLPSPDPNLSFGSLLKSLSCPWVGGGGDIKQRHKQRQTLTHGLACYTQILTSYIPSYGIS